MKRIGVLLISVSAMILGSVLFEGGVPVVMSAAAESSSPAASVVPAPESAPAKQPVVVDPRTGRADSDRSTGCLTDPTVLEDLQAQREKMVNREKEITTREAELKAREQAVSEQLKKLDEIRGEIAKTEAFHKKDMEAKVDKLVETIQSMSPKTAAKMINELDETLAVAAMEKMDTIKLAKIMGNLEPKKSSRLSELLAGVVLARDVVATQARTEGARVPASTETNKATSGSPH
jgi:flagellar motility protein MotE (MotC chaperone)